MTTFRLRMILRDVLDTDLAIFFEHQRQPDANRMAALAPRDRNAFMEHWKTRILEIPSATAKAVVVDGVVVGNVVSWLHGGRRLVGYWIGQEHWGRGMATEALAQFVAEHETMRPLHAYVAAHNLASIRVLEKCGFRPVGQPVRGSDGVEELSMVLRDS